MRVTSFGLAWGALVLLTVLVFGELLVAGQECVSLADNTGSAQTAQKTIAPLAQKLVLNDDCYVQSFTISLAPALSSVQLSEAAVYSDNDNTPGSQLADGTFDISTPLNISATTLYTFNSTRPEGIQLYVGSSYWLVVNNPNIVYQTLSITSYQSATNTTIIDLGELGQYNYGFQEWTIIGTQSFRVALQGCRGVLPPSPSPSASPSPSPSPANSPPPSPSPSPASPPAGSPSPAPALSPVVSNVKASFAPQRPVVDMVADAIAPGAVGVRSYLRDLRVGDQQPNLDEFEVEVKAGTEAAPTIYTYTAVLSDNATRFGQEFAFYNDSAEASFDSIGFSISPGTLKWSLNLTTNASSEPFTVRYGLSALITASTSTAEIAPTEEAIVRQAATPQPGMTTYFLPFVTLPSSSAPRQLLAKVEVFDAALVDGVSVALHHEVVVTPNTNGSAEYVLVLEFAAFSSSLFYDPSLSLGVLLGADDNSGGDDNLALIVATSVVLPVALLLVVLVSVVGAVAVWHRKRVARRRVRDRVSRLKDQL